MAEPSQVPVCKLTDEFFVCGRPSKFVVSLKLPQHDEERLIVRSYKDFQRLRSVVQKGSVKMPPRQSILTKLSSSRRATRKARLQAFLSHILSASLGKNADNPVLTEFLSSGDDYNEQDEQDNLRDVRLQLLFASAQDYNNPRLYNPCPFDDFDEMKQSKESSQGSSRSTSETSCSSSSCTSFAWSENDWPELPKAEGAHEVLHHIAGDSFTFSRGSPSQSSPRSGLGIQNAYKQEPPVYAQAVEKMWEKMAARRATMKDLGDSAFAEADNKIFTRISSLAVNLDTSDEGDEIEYTVVFDQMEGKTLGLQGSSDDGVRLVIDDIVSGLVADWNEQNPCQKVMIGDRIKEVNGIRDDALAMVEECKQNTVLTITLCRKVGFQELVSAYTLEVVLEKEAWMGQYDDIIEDIADCSTPALPDDAMVLSPRTGEGRRRKEAFQGPAVAEASEGKQPEHKALELPSLVIEEAKSFLLEFDLWKSFSAAEPKTPAQKLPDSDGPPWRGLCCLLVAQDCDEDPDKPRRPTKPYAAKAEVSDTTSEENQVKIQHGLWF